MYFRFSFLWNSNGKHNRKILPKRFCDQSHLDSNLYDDEWLLIMEVL